jgi:hypothetical protein
MPNNIEQDKIINAQQDKIEELLTVRLLTPKMCSFKRTEGGFVSLEMSGGEKEEKYDRILLYRAFPFTAPNQYISVREADTKAREIGLIEDLSVFPEDVRVLLNGQMELRYFTPKISRVLDVKQEFGYAYWDVLTDRGPCKFTMNSGSIPHLTETRLLISDIDGNRFEIVDYTQLPQADVKKLDLFL